MAGKTLLSYSFPSALEKEPWGFAMYQAVAWWRQSWPQTNRLVWKGTPWHYSWENHSTASGNLNTRLINTSGHHLQELCWLESNIRNLPMFLFVPVWWSLCGWNNCTQSATLFLRSHWLWRFGTNVQTLTHWYIFSLHQVSPMETSRDPQDVRNYEGAVYNVGRCMECWRLGTLPWSTWCGLVWKVLLLPSQAEVLHCGGRTIVKQGRRHGLFSLSRGDQSKVQVPRCKRQRSLDGVVWVW